MFLTKPGFVSFEKGIIFNFELQQKHEGYFCDGEFAKHAPASAPPGFSPRACVKAHARGELPMAAAR
jgi:hypothetical protein